MSDPLPIDVPRTLTHLDEAGNARMVDISNKPPSLRVAEAEATLVAARATVEALLAGSLEKGDALAVARIAGIMAAKKTADLVPLCHPIALTAVTVDIVPLEDMGGLRVLARAETVGGTGVEMEAMTAASVAALTLYDMAKAIERAMTITDLRLVSKSGGRSGDFLRVA